MNRTMKIGIILIIVLVTYITGWAAEPREGIKYFKCGLPEIAKSMLIKDLETEEDGQAEICYYLGEIYYLEQKLDSASYYYQRGIVSDPTYGLNRIGAGKLLLSTDVPAAEEQFAVALGGKNKKDPSLLLAIARAYDANHIDKATEYLNRAKTVDPHYPGIYVLEGDRLWGCRKNGEACSRYEQAVYFDPTCIEAYVKYARIYANTNPQVGLDMLQKLVDIDPESLIAWHEMAELYYAASRYKEAAEAYEKCIASAYSTDKELMKYATVLFYYGQYQRSLKYAEEVLQRAPHNTVMKRIRMYDLFELKAYETGIEMAVDFFKSAPDSDLIGQDYLFYGRLLEGAQKVAEAIPQLEKALALDTMKVELYKELATAYEKLNRYDSAAMYYHLFIRKGDKQVSLADYLMLGKCHYFAGNSADSTESGVEQRKMHFEMADSVFAYVAEKAPDSYLGNFWRARVNSSLDPETSLGLAKPYYETAAACLEQSHRNLNLLVECYCYLGYYYYLKNEFPESKEYWNKILAVDPQNDTARKALAGIK